MQGTPSSNKPRVASVRRVPSSPQDDSSAGLMSSTAAQNNTSQVSPDAEQLDLPTEVPAALPDARIPRSALQNDLDITTPIWVSENENAGTHIGDYYLLYVNGELLNEDGILVEDLESPFVYPYPKAKMDAIPEGSVVPVRFQLSLLSMPGELEYLSLPYTVFFDKQKPGGAVLPAILFAEDLVKNGLTLAKLLTLPGEVLSGKIPNYEYQEETDTINLFMRLRDGGVEIPAGSIGSNRSGEIVVTFDRTTLEKIKGYGTVDFYYEVVDEVGNRSEARSPVSPLDLLIDGAPEVIPAPLVPGFDDDDPAAQLVIDGDARPALAIQIPAYQPPPREGDSFIVHVGTQAVTAGPLKAADIGKNPVLSIGFPYALLFPDTEDGDEPDPIFTADVSYDVVRVGFASPSQVKPVDFDLSLAGGVDPAPEPDPGIDPPLPDNPNDNLALPTLRGKSGAENDLPPADTRLEGTGIVPWLNLSTPPAAALALGDIVQLHIGGDDVGDTYEVTQDDVDAAADLEIAVPQDDMEAHTGLGKFWYSVERTLTGGATVTASSRPQAINLQSLDDLPGGGTLFEATFVEAVNKRTYAINYENAISGGGCPVRIRLDQANVGVGDTVTWRFKGVVTDGGVTPPQELDPITGTEISGTHVISREDMVPREDATLPKPPVRPPVPATRPFTDVLVETRYILPCTTNSGVFIYTIENASGAAPDAVDLVRMDVRVP